MAVQVFRTPDELPEPEFADFMSREGGFNSEGYFGAVREHTAKLAEWCKDNTDSRNPIVGETFSFPVADGRAEYMVFRTSPLQVIHLNYGDGYQADAITMRGLRVSDIKQKVGASKRINALFGGIDE